MTWQLITFCCRLNHRRHLQTLILALLPPAFPRLTFPNKTQKLKHKRGAHKYQREILEQCNLELEIHSQEILENIYYIEDHQPPSKEYLCKYKNNETDWVTIIDDTNPHVIQYFNQKQKNITIFDTDSVG